MRSLAKPVGLVRIATRNQREVLMRHASEIPTAPSAPSWTTNDDSYAQRRVGARPRPIWTRLRRPAFLVGLVFADALTPIAALAAAYYLRYAGVPGTDSFTSVIASPNVQLAILLTIFVHVALIRQAGLYQLHKPWLMLDFMARIGVIVFATALTLFVAGLALRALPASRLFFGYFAFLLFSITVTEKLLGRIVVLLMFCFGVGIKKAVIIGRNETARSLFATFQEHPELGYRVIAMLFRGTDAEMLEGIPHTSRQEGPPDRLMRRLRDIGPNLVILADPVQKGDDTIDIVEECLAARFEVRFVPQFQEVYSTRLQMDLVGVTPMIHLHAPKLPVVTALAKRLVDLTAGIVMLPFYAVACAILRKRMTATSEPVVTSQKRLGLRGMPFLERRFNPGVEPLRPIWSLLPQSINLLSGEMALVGPRATEPERAAHFDSWEKRAFATRPGLIGYGAPNDAVTVDARGAQMAWDIAYVDKASLAFDLSVIAASVFRLLRAPAQKPVME